MKKIILPIVILIVFLNSECSAQASGYSRIITAFNNWKTNQIKAGNYLEKCQPVLGDGPVIIGEVIPSELSVSFAYINSDTLLDALITFIPEGCNMGMGLRNVQRKILVLSNGISYRVDAVFFENIEKKLSNGWILMNRASGDSFLGTYYEYKSEDAMCCPSIKKEFWLGYKDKKIIYSD